MTHEIAVLKRLKFAAQSERVAPEQRNLLDETIDTDIAGFCRNKNGGQRNIDIIRNAYLANE
jgi:hypothetical protein